MSNNAQCQNLRTIFAALVFEARRMTVGIDTKTQARSLSADQKSALSFSIAGQGYHNRVVQRYE